MTFWDTVPVRGRQWLRYPSTAHRAASAGVFRSMAKDHIERVSESGEFEAWVREIDDDLRGVEAVQLDTKGDWLWQVGGAMAEFVRDVPLEGEMQGAVNAAIRSVPGVTGVAQEDRELWIVAGTPSGEALVRAVGAATDPLVERASTRLENLD
ncbi:MAG: hypothetical protein ABIP03_02755 [Aquihabitans sp.]